MRVLLLTVALLCLGCADGDEGEPFAVFHLETSVGPPAAQGDLRCGPPRPVCPGVVRQPPRREFRYERIAEPALTGDDIDRMSVRNATDPSTGMSLVVVDLTAAGTAAFARLTLEVARFGARDEAWHHVAIVVGDEIVAFPQVDYDAYPDGIAGAPALQMVAASAADARDLVRRLRGG
jgi:hypothetical protein